MAIVYAIVVLFDFVVGPVFWTLIQVFAKGSVVLQWTPLTLLGGGVFHASMGAILGISALTRGQERIEMAKGDAAVRLADVNSALASKV